jgi:hypothetical protein
MIPPELIEKREYRSTPKPRRTTETLNNMLTQFQLTGGKVVVYYRPA